MEPVTILTGAAAAIVGKKILTKITGSLYATSSEGLRKRIKKWQAKSKIQTLYSKIASVRNVKTLWQVDRAVDLLRFYYPSNLLVDGKRMTLTNIGDLEYDGNLVIEGTVGQGKSIFMRFLCSQELLRGDRIPTFIELRRIQPGETLFDHICDACALLGLDVDRGMFNFLAGEGKLHLFLDGFDEIDEKHRTKLITEIESLAGKYPKLRLVISSRPDSGIDRSPAFRIYKLAPIAPNEVNHVITKLMGDDTAAQGLIQGLNRSRNQIAGLLTTPLMITLLVVTYKANQTIPDRLSEFFEGLFLLLLIRHDRTKPGFVRKRKSELSDKPFRELFECFCFLTKKLIAPTLTRRQAVDLITESIRLSQHACDSDAFLDDISRITCLLLDEGGKFTFIHKSVQEFYAAAYIRAFPERTAKKFYEAIRKKGAYNWQQELVFLEHIDQYRFCRFFLIPDLEGFVGNVLKVSTKKRSKITRAALMRFAECVQFRGTIKKSSGGWVTWTNIGLPVSLVHAIESDALRPIAVDVFNALANKKIVTQLEQFQVASTGEGNAVYSIRADALFKLNVVSRTTIVRLENSMASLCSALLDAKQYVAQRESMDSLIDF